MLYFHGNQLNDVSKNPMALHGKVRVGVTVTVLHSKRLAINIKAGRSSLQLCILLNEVVCLVDIYNLTITNSCIDYEIILCKEEVST